MVAKVTAKGQVTIPSHIRKRLGISYGDKVDFQVRGHRVVLEPCREELDVDDLKGILPTRRRATDAQIRRAKEKALSKKWKHR